ncbi:unnamed protein product [Choristocarpus tenellus]
MGMGSDSKGLAAEEGRLDTNRWGEDMVKLRYEEGSTPEAFFLPYLWRLVYDLTPDLNWASRKIVLFDLPLPQVNPPAIAAVDLPLASANNNVIWDDPLAAV